MIATSPFLPPVGVEAGSGARTWQRSNGAPFRALLHRGNGADIGMFAKPARMGRTWFFWIRILPQGRNNRVFVPLPRDLPPATGGTVRTSASSPASRNAASTAAPPPLVGRNEVGPRWSPASLVSAAHTRRFPFDQPASVNRFLHRPPDLPPCHAPVLQAIDLEKGRSGPLAVLDRRNRPADERTEATHQATPARVRPSSGPLPAFEPDRSRSGIPAVGSSLT